MTSPALQICFHDHCFDGVASAATFLRFHRDRIAPVGDDQLRLRGLAHKAGALFGDEIYQGKTNCIVDFRFAADPRLTWWFDHHQSAFETPADRAAFEADATGRKHWDPAAKSCTKFLARVAKEKFGFDESPLRELIDWAEIIDGALFPSAKVAVELTEPAMQLMLLIEATRDEALCPRLVRALSTHTLSDVIAEPWVQEPLVPLLARHRELVATVLHRLKVDGGVCEYDLADTGVDNINKFIAYFAHPDATYTVSVTRSERRSKISLGSNPWRQDQRKHNLAKMAERHGGGGHPAVSAISFKPEELERAREVARSLAAELRS